MANYLVTAVMPRVLVNGSWEIYAVITYLGDNWTDVTPQPGDEISANVTAEGMVSDLVLEAMQSDPNIIILSEVSVG